MVSLSIFFFNDTATTEIYTLSLHDALPILAWIVRRLRRRLVLRIVSDADCDPRRQITSTFKDPWLYRYGIRRVDVVLADRKSTRLNSSHSQISYAVFCLK